MCNTASITKRTLYHPSRRGVTPKLRARVDFLKMHASDAPV